MNVNDISLVRYDIRQGRIIYCSRNMIYLHCKYRIISVPQYAQRISSVLQGTDIIEKTQDFSILGFFFGADYGARTRHLHLGKVALYQMS